MLVVNKIDSRQLDDLAADEQEMIKEIVDSGVNLVQMSCYTDVGLMDVRNAACEKLLAARVESKMRGTKAESILQRIHVAMPSERDEKVGKYEESSIIYS